jgi:SAM-dependent methyltransferase
VGADDRERWDARHTAAGRESHTAAGRESHTAAGRESHTAAGRESHTAAAALSSPAPPRAVPSDLINVVPTTGRALDVACGRGGVAVWLALRGLAVDAVDVSPAGLAAGARLAGAHGVDERIRWIAHDLDDGLPAACTGPYDVVVCQCFREPSMYGALAAALAPGGLLAVTVLSEVGSAPGPFRAAPGELRAAFSGLEVLRDREGGGEASLLARPPVPGSPPGPPPRS